MQSASRGLSSYILHKLGANPPSPADVRLHAFDPRLEGQEAGVNRNAARHSLRYQVAHMLPFGTALSRVMGQFPGKLVEKLNGDRTGNIPVHECEAQHQF